MQKSDIEFLFQKYEYCLDSGLLTLDGRPVGWRGARGHLKITVYPPSGKRSIFVHCLIWAFLHGEWPDFMVDHADRDKDNNRPENLRPADHSTNGANCAARGASGYKGVTKSGSRWLARIGGGDHRQTRCERLGSYPTPQEAARAYDRRALELYGEHAVLNFPIEERCADATNDPIGNRDTFPERAEACYNFV